MSSTKKVKKGKKKIRRGKKREVNQVKEKKKTGKEESAYQYKDPWDKLPSAWGGRASPAEEFTHLLAHGGGWVQVHHVVNHELVTMFRCQELAQVRKQLLIQANGDGDDGGDGDGDGDSSTNNNKKKKKRRDNKQQKKEEVEPIVTAQELPPMTSLSGDALDLCIDLALNPPKIVENIEGGSVTTSKTIDKDGSGVHVTTVVSTTENTETKEHDSYSNSNSVINNEAPVQVEQQMAWGDEPWTPRSSKGQKSNSTTSPLERIAAAEAEASETKQPQQQQQQQGVERGITKGSAASILGGLRLSLANIGLSELNLSSSLRCRLIALNLNNNQFTEETVCCFTNVPLPQLVLSADLSVSCTPLYLREITLQRNNLTIIPNLGEACHTLLALDLSESHVNVADPKSEEHLRLMTRLRSLTLRSCGISRLCRQEPGRNEQQTLPRCSLSSRTATLESLDVSNNAILNFQEVGSLVCLKRLAKLNIDGNPVSQLEDHSENVRKVCLKLSSLKVFNGHSYKHGMLAAQFTDMELSANYAGGGDDSSSCSCIEGNPCLVAYNCKNWARRYEIAKAHGWKGF